MGDQVLVDEKLCREKHDGLIRVIDSELRVITTQIAAMATALELEAKDREGRYLNLNNLRKEVTEDRAMLVRVDVYRADLDKMTTLIDGLRIRISESESRSATWAKAIVIAFAAIQVALHFWK